MATFINTFFLGYVSCIIFPQERSFYRRVNLIRGNVTITVPAIALGRAPHVVITVESRRIPRRRDYFVLPYIYTACRGRDGRFRLCNLVHYFYLCYSLNVSYCVRSRESGNVMVDVRICRRITIQELRRRFALTGVDPSRVASERISVATKMWRYINALATCMSRDLYARLLRSILNELNFSLTQYSLYEAFEILVPRIYDRATGSQLYCCSKDYRYRPLNTFREEPLREDELVYAYICRCPQLPLSTLTLASGTLPLEDLVSLFRKYVYSKIRGETDEEVERQIYTFMDYIRREMKCRSVINGDNFRWMLEAYRTINTTQYANRCAARCRLI